MNKIEVYNSPCSCILFVFSFLLHSLSPSSYESWSHYNYLLILPDLGKIRCPKYIDKCIHIRYIYLLVHFNSYHHESKCFSLWSFFYEDNLLYFTFTVNFLSSRGKRQKNNYLIRSNFVSIQYSKKHKTIHIHIHIPTYMYIPSRGIEYKLITTR